LDQLEEINSQAIRVIRQVIARKRTMIVEDKDDDDNGDPQIDTYSGYRFSSYFLYYWI